MEDEFEGLGPEEVEEHGLAEQPLDEEGTTSVLVTSNMGQVRIPILAGWTAGQVVDATGYTLGVDVTIMVNGETASQDTLVNDKDVVSLFGRVKGG